MRRFFAMLFLLTIATTFTAGCEKKSEVKTETKMTGPGGTTTVTDTEKVETTENNPPAEAK
jgi:hypothetical protein